MDKKITFLIAFFTLCAVNAQTTFDWDTPTPIDNGNNVTQTIDGITTTFTGTADPSVFATPGGNGSQGDLLSSSPLNSGITTSSVTFSFSTAVDVTSVVIVSHPTAFTYTFTPNGASNSAVNNITGSQIVNLNWSDVTSFVVTANQDFIIGFDNLIVSESTLSNNNFTHESISIYPNPVRDFLYFENVKNLKSARIYNSLGQLVSETKETKIDFRNLISGVYILQLNTDKETINKRIIKK